MMKKCSSIQTSFIFMVRLIWSITNMFIDTFMSVYFLQVSGDNLYKLIGYNMLRIILLCFFFVLFSGQAKSRNRLNLVRISLIGCICFFTTLLILGDRSCNYWWLLAIFWGMTTGIYHCGYNSFEIDNLKGINRGKFLGIYESVNYISRIILPVFFGYVIDSMGFSADFMIILILTGLHMAVLFVLKDTRNWENEEHTCLISFFHEFKHKDWFVPNFLAHVFAGLSHSCTALNLLASILILQVAVNSTEIGIVTSLGYIAASICGILFSRFYKNKKLVIRWHWFLTLLYSISLIFLFACQSPLSILSYYFIQRIFRMSATTVCDTAEGNVVLKNKLNKYSQEFYTWADIQYAIGRTTGYLLLILYFVFKPVLLIFILGLIFSAYYALKLSEYLDIQK